MDEHSMSTVKKRIERTAAALQKANMETHCVETAAQALELIKSLVPKGATVASGGSMSLADAGVISLLQNGDYNYLDRTKPGITPEEIGKVYRDAFSADFYLTSSNAITENGELVNADGNSNRVAAISFGPNQVIVLAGANKIVKNIDEAVARIKNHAAPSNVHRLSCQTPCAHTGKCESCTSTGCICCTWTVHRFCRVKGRIIVILVQEELGY